MIEGFGKAHVMLEYLLLKVRVILYKALLRARARKHMRRVVHQIREPHVYGEVTLVWN